MIELAMVWAMGTLCLLGVLGYRALRLIDQRVGEWLKLKEAHEERQSNPPQAAPPPPLPADLLMWAHRESEEWAREQAIAHLYEVYDKTRNWDHVRSVVTAK